MRFPTASLLDGRGILARGAFALLLCAGLAAWAEPAPVGPGPAEWAGDLTPIGQADWSSGRAAHLLERAGFGGTPEDVARLAAMSPAEAVADLMGRAGSENAGLAPFDPSDIHDPGLDPFPVSRPAATDQARATGEALGIKVKPDGNRRLQPVADKFFYWLRASRLETDRIAYWWANRMVVTPHPLKERMALFWHGHFATNDDKVRDARKMVRQLELFQRAGTGNFRDLMVAVAQDPAMLAFLDAGVNVKGKPNENFAREIMELFTLGVGNYSERDIREAARAFTGWNFRGVQFVVNADAHDDGEKTVLGRTGRFDGVQVIDLLLDRPVAGEFIAGKIYGYLVREDVPADMKRRVGALLREQRWEIAPFLTTLLLSRDFYSPPAFATRIKSPVDLVVSSCRKLGLKEVPGVPDFNETTTELGQHLLQPPTVAGWSGGRSWVTPGLLIERGNFARDLLFPDINFIPPDRYNPDEKVRQVSDKLALGVDVTSATMQDGRETGNDMAMSNKMADRDEDFNTRMASFRGWQMALQRVKPIARAPARIDLTAMVARAGAATTAQAVDHLLARLLSAPVAPATRTRLIAFLDRELGTSDLNAARSFMEEPLRQVVHLIMSLPEYQLG